MRRIHLAQSGDRQALDELLRAQQRPLYRYLQMLVEDPSLAQDLLQDVLLTVCKKLGALKEPLAFRAWVFRIARRAAFKSLKAKHREVAVPSDEILAGLVVPPEQRLSELRIDTRQMLSTLSVAGREVIALHYGQGFTLSEIAHATDVPLGTVKSRLSQALAVLRRVDT